MKLRKFWPLVTLLVLLIVAAPALAADDLYTDINGHPASQAIIRWSNMGILKGNNNLFRPDDTITRAEMATILDRVILYPALPKTLDPASDPAAPTYILTADNPFRDVDMKAWYAEAVLKLNLSGVMLGSNGAARPLDTISRQEATVMVCRSLGLDDLAGDSQPQYSDGADISSWAAACVGYLQARGYITDSPENFRPRQAITRSEVVVLLNNICGRLEHSSGLFTRSVSGNCLVSSAKYMLLNSHIQGDLIICGAQTDKVIVQNSVIDGEIINHSGAQLITIPPGRSNSTELLFGQQELRPVENIAVNPYYGADFSRDGKGRLVYAKGGTRTGVDVSDWQGAINWRQVKADGIDFAIIRVAYRGYTDGLLQEDPLARQNLAGAEAAGLKIGAYVYSQALNEDEALEEAELALSILEGYDLDYPLVFDWETSDDPTVRTSTMEGAAITRLARVFCDRVRSAGYDPMVYAYAKLAYLYYDLNQIKDYDFWFAGYYDTPDFYYDMDMWQYTSSGTVNGINGRVDLNLDFVNY